MSNTENMPRGIQRQAEKYKEQLDNYCKDFVDDIQSGKTEAELDEAYQRLDKSWRRTAAFVNTGNRGFALNVDAFEKRINKMVEHAKAAAQEKAQEMNHISNTQQAETLFIKEVMLPVAIAVARITLFLIGVNLY